jgi:hypothetical protein
MFEITAFIVLTSAMVRGVLVLEGALVLEGVLEEERVQAHRGRQDEDLMSGLQGGDLASSCDCPAMLSLVITMFISCFVKSTMGVAILDVFRYSLSPPFLGWQFCCVHIYDCLCCWLL